MLQGFFHAQHGRDTAIGTGKTCGPFSLRGRAEQRSEFVAKGERIIAADAASVGKP